MSTNALPNVIPQLPDTSTTTTTSTTPLADPPSPYPNHPPAALTIVLSIVCGLVATCILLTIVLLLLRHRSSKQAFRQGQQQQQPPNRTSSIFNFMPKSKSHPDGANDGLGSRNTRDEDSLSEVVEMYLPVLLHNDSSPAKANLDATTDTHVPDGCDSHDYAFERPRTVPYPKAAYLGSESPRPNVV